MSDESDDELVGRARRGDRAALDDLLERHVDRVYAVCLRIVGDRTDALDATQEALIAVARGVAHFDGRSAFSTWVYRVATNAALDEIRRRSRRPTPIDELPESPRVGSPGIDERVADSVLIDGALREIPEEFRAAVVLRDLHDLDYAQIAVILDVPPGTVRSRISRGRAALASVLGNPADLAQRQTEQDP